MLSQDRQQRSHGSLIPGILARNGPSRWLCGLTEAVRPISTVDTTRFWEGLFSTKNRTFVTTEWDNPKQMPLPPEQRFKFFVFIVESPSAIDLYRGLSEGEMIRRAVELNGIHCTSKLATNLEMFVLSMREGIAAEMKHRPGYAPLLHISAHGFDHGIQLASGEVLTWDALRQLLVPLNTFLSGNLLVCMSTCKGYSGQRMAMVHEEDRHPFFALIGNGGEPTWPETAVAFATFYHLFGNGHYLEEAVAAMRVASGNDKFWVITAKDARQGYLDFLSLRSLELAASQIQKQEAEEPSSEVAKRFRIEGEASVAG